MVVSRRDKRLVEQIKEYAPLIYDVVMTEDRRCKFSAISADGIVRKKVGMLLPEWWGSDKYISAIIKGQRKNEYKKKTEKFLGDLDTIPYQDLSKEDLRNILVEIKHCKERSQSVAYLKTFEEKVSLLMTLGSQYTLNSPNDEKILYEFIRYLTVLGGDNWSSNWESLFPSNDEKITLLKGVVLQEKIDEKNKANVFNSVSVTILVFRKIIDLGLDSPELFDWVLKNKSSNPYTPLGSPLPTHIIDHVGYMDFMNSEKKSYEKKHLRHIEIEKEHTLNREKKRNEKLRKKNLHDKRMAEQKRRNTQLYGDPEN